MKGLFIGISVFLASGAVGSIWWPAYNPCSYIAKCFISSYAVCIFVAILLGLKLVGDIIITLLKGR